MINYEDGEINLLGSIGVLIFGSVLTAVVLGIRWFFGTFDSRMNRRLEEYVASKDLDDEHE